MTAIDSIRRNLRESAWLRFSAEPFAGAVHSFDVPLRKRFEQREYASPYYWHPTAPGKGRGFYQGKGLYCDKHGSTFDLRLELANDHLPRRGFGRAEGYYADNSQDSVLTPIIARLPHGRGFLAGWTMGASMCASIGAEIYEDEESAAYAAHSMAEYDAEQSREAEQRENEETADAD